MVDVGREQLTEENSMKDETNFSASFHQRKRTLLITGVVVVIAVILFIIGVVLLSSTNKDCSNESNEGSTGTSTGDGATTPSPGIRTDRCSFSDEAKRIDLDGLLKELQDTYYKLFPNQIAWRPASTTDDVRREFRVFNHTPAAIKQRTDVAMNFLGKLNQMKIDTSLLKPREHKALLQMKHFLKYPFGLPYEGNYYAADWMLGPNPRCAQPFCGITYDINNGIGNMAPHNRSELVHVLNHLKSFKDTIHQFIDNMRLGIKTGMVRTITECKAALSAIKSRFSKTSADGKNKTAVTDEWFFRTILKEKFVQYLDEEVTNQWKQETGMFPNESIRHAAVENIGQSIHDLLTYLEFDHINYCRPDDVGPGGLSGLPIDVIYFNGTVQPNSTTTKTLPIMENGKYPKINGSESYTKILGFFTTTDATPDEVHALGWKQLDIGLLYPQVIDIAKTTTNKANGSQAISEFQKILVDNTVSYFNKKPLPENETSGDAFTKCKDEEGAKKYCPNRWAAMQDWFSFARRAMSLLDPKTVDFFYFTGKHHTTPNCPVQLRPNFNPISGAQSYSRAGTDCKRNSYYNIPFFLRNLGPVYSEYSVNAHEARPGHHTQSQGNAEHFKDSCGGLPRWLDDATYYTAFTEGWALYAENPLIAKDTDTYKNNLMQKYGMLKWQIWRALRLIVDTGLHYKGFSRQRALDLFAEYAWDRTDLAEKEVLRYISRPGQATAYMIGQLAIIKIRNYATEQLGNQFSLKDFHFQTLSQGSSPLQFLENHIHQYVACVKKPKKNGCSIILDPPTDTETSQSASYNNNNYYLEESPVQPIEEYEL